MADPWPSAGHGHLARDARGWLAPGDGWWRLQLARPELALVAESCAAERALHAALQAEPRRPVTEAELAGLADADARDNWRVFLRWRDRVLGCGSIEAAYVRLFTSGGPVDLAPAFVDAMAQAILRHLLDESDDAFEWRAAEMLFRPQRCAAVEGRLLAGDREALDRLDGGLARGEIGRWLAQAGIGRRHELELLAPDLAPAYFAQAEAHRFLLDLTTELDRDLGHGVSFKLANARSGLRGLARVLERWVAHLLGAAVRITPQARIDDPDWRWHLGLDAQATAFLNDLHAGREPAVARSAIVGLFRLDFADPGDVRPEVAGSPVWLAAAHDAEGVLRLKPQNLLLNLPLAARS